MKEKLDLSIKENADKSRNLTVLIGMIVLNIILTLAYSLELIKKTRSPLSFAIVAILCIAPCIISYLIYRKKKDATAIRYVFSGFFVAMYAYVMFTGTTMLTFC